MTGLAPYAVDLDQLAGTVSDLAACGRAFDELLTDLRARVARLHVTWTGEAATAQAHAQAEWESGFAAMRDALREMREAARVAHHDYTAAVEANVHLWSRR